MRVVAGVDLDPACRYPFERNISAPFFQRDVCSLRGDVVREWFGPATVKVLAGCAPCQPFSGYTTRHHEIDERWKLLLEFGRLVVEVKPDIVTLENVPRLAHLALWDDFVSTLRHENFAVAWSVLDAADFGVPQNRRRLVLLASRHGEINLPRPNVRDRATVRQAISFLPVIKAGDQSRSDPLHTTRGLTARNLARIKNSRPGRTWRDWPKAMRVKCHMSETGKTYPSVYGRMSWDKPSPTITTQFYGFGNGRFGHPDQHRAISLREGALLQSFPPDYRFVPAGKRISFREVGRLIGNAVPPNLAYAIGVAIHDHIQTFSL